MKAFFIDIFEYHHEVNQHLIKVLNEQRSCVNERTIPLFGHMVDAHHIWNSRILQRKALFEVNEVHPLEAVQRIDSSNLADTLAILSDFNLENKVSYTNTKGNTFENSIQQILFHVNNHFTHHRGQLISDLRMSGGIPPVTDYIFYRR
jgi:uncharacterized damage-inducible protein DinB